MLSGSYTLIIFPLYRSESTVTMKRQLLSGQLWGWFQEPWFLHSYLHVRFYHWLEMFGFGIVTQSPSFQRSHCETVRSLEFTEIFSPEGSQRWGPSALGEQFRPRTPERRGFLGNTAKPLIFPTKGDVLWFWCWIVGIFRIREAQTTLNGTTT